MKINFNRQKFAAAFTIAASAVPGRTPKDILKNVCMTVSEGSIEFSATDQEIGIRVRVDDVETCETGDVLLPTAKLAAILRELTDETLELTIDDQNITVKSSSGKFRLLSEDPKEFPPVPEFSDEDYFQVAASLFKRMIHRTAFATDSESTRYALGGISIEFTDDAKVILAATDSRRLSVAKAICEQHGARKFDHKTTVVPTKAMLMIERAVDPKAELIDIAVHDNSVMFRSGNVTISSRLVEGRFPRWRDVIPQRQPIIVPLPVGPFFAAVRQSQIVTSEESRGVDFTFHKAALTIKSSAASIGESSIELPIEYDHEKLAITFDPKYVADVLKVLGPETVVDLHLTDEDTAAVLTVDDSYTYVIMPLAKDR